MSELEIQNKSILDYWPTPEYKIRKSQEKALKWIESLPSTVKYILLEAPTGTGKSQISVTTSAWMSRSQGNSFILTPQKILQAQYEETFNSRILYGLYGRRNYECISKKTTCDIAGDIRPFCSDCICDSAFAQAMCSPNLVLNYTLALLLFKYNKKISPRKLLVLDECHQLEKFLVEFNSVSISQLRCKKMKINYYNPKTIKRALEYIETDYFPAVVNKLREYKEIIDDLNDELEFNPRPLSAEERSSFKNCKEFAEHHEALRFVMTMTMEDVEERFVLVDEKQSFKFKELYGKNVFHALLKPKFDRCLMMSSTILNKNEFCKDLGLDPSQAAFLALDSEFELENRPVFFIPTAKVNYSFLTDPDRENDRNNIILKTKEIIDTHKNESGIIHTANFNLAEFLLNSLSPIIDHVIYHHNPGSKMERGDVIDEFMRVAPTQPSILMSPSCTEGLDAKDACSRFSIIIKIPYQNLGDNWAKKRKELNESWYQRTAVSQVIQATGRSVRHENDYAISYILDSSFNFLLYTQYKNIPDWWKTSIIRP